MDMIYYSLFQDTDTTDYYYYYYYYYYYHYYYQAGSAMNWLVINCN